MPNNSMNSIISSIRPFIHDMRNRDLQDMQSIQAIRGDNRMNKIFGGPNSPNPAIPGQMFNGQQPNVVLGPQTVNPNVISALGQAQLNQAKNANLADIKLRSRELDIQEKSGEGRLALDREKSDITALKNQNTSDDKIKEIETRATTAENALAVASKTAEGRQQTAEELARLQKLRDEAINERHALDIAQRDRALAAKTGEDKKKDNIQGIRDKVTQALTTIDKIVDPKTGKLKPEAQNAVGMSRNFQMHRFSGTNSATATAHINELKANQLIELIGEMKAQSRTGATGFGALNLKELGLLEAAATGLDPNKDEGAFETSIKEVASRLRKILEKAKDEEVEETRTPRSKSGATPSDKLDYYSR